MNCAAVCRLADAGAGGGLTGSWWKTPGSGSSSGGEAGSGSGIGSGGNGGVGSGSCVLMAFMIVRCEWRERRLQGRRGAEFNGGGGLIAKEAFDDRCVAYLIVATV